MDGIEIIYEDEKLLAVNKPTGISVHPSRKEPDGTLVDWLRERYPEIRAVGEDAERPGIVHRLDKETSGVLVVAKTQEAFVGLKALFKSRNVQKRYLALVDGVIKEPRGTIAFPVGRVGLKMGVVRPGQKELLRQRDARTVFIVRKRFVDATLVELQPKTGRMHQIRVHMNAIGRPVLGDKFYGGKQVRARAPRHMLHAWKLAFTLHGTDYAFEADIPGDFEERLNDLAEQTRDE